MLGMLVRVSAVLTFSGITIHWAPFHSPTYPYTILQPSSYKYLAITNTSGRPVDYFFPSLGSQLTNVNVYCDHGHMNAMRQLRSVGAVHVQRNGGILIDGTRRALIRGEFRGMVAQWTVEQIVFTANGRVWHLTASYEHRFRSQRTIMMKMLKSFKPE
jgi:hypothetical protein